MSQLYDYFYASEVFFFCMNVAFNILKIVTHFIFHYIVFEDFKHFPDGHSQSN